MKAIVCNELGPPEKLVLEERPDLEPGPGAALVEVAACGVNFVDALFIQGLYQVKPPPPFTPGFEVAGVVAALGEGVSEVVMGDRVIAMPGLGGYASQVVTPAGRLVAVPEGLDLARAAAFTQSYCTALYALDRRGDVRAGEKLLVLGAGGGVGLAAVDVGKALGATVIAAASSEEKLAACEAAGADALLDYTADGATGRELKSRVRELAGGPVDLVYDPVGGEYAEPALRALAPGGRYLVIGFATGEIPRVPFNLVLLKSCQVVGVDWGASTQREPDLMDSLMAQLAELLAEGRLRPAAPSEFPLERAGDALRALMDRRIAGKAVLVP